MAKLSRRASLGSIIASTVALWLVARNTVGGAQATSSRPKGEMVLSDAEWRRRLSPKVYRILRQAETEHPFTSPLNTEHRRGIFSCAGCDLPLYSATAKFDSGTGWPSFWEHLPNAVRTMTDYELGLPRTEVHCRRCAGHLGHVFDDGPRPTGKRHCINGLSLNFKPENA